MDEEGIRYQTDLIEAYECNTNSKCTCELYIVRLAKLGEKDIILRLVSKGGHNHEDTADLKSLDQYLSKRIRKWGSMAARMDPRDMMEQFKKEYFTNSLILKGVTDKDLHGIISKQLKHLSR